MKVHGYKLLFFIGILAVLIPKTSEACIPKVNWGSTVTFCQGNVFTLNAANPNSTYVWSTGASTPTIPISASGQYWVVVTNQCGSATDTLDVIVEQALVVNLGTNRSVCSSTPTVLIAPQSPTATYQWQDNSTNDRFTVTQSGTYHVTVTNACGTYSDTVTITMDTAQTVSLGADIVRCDTISSVLQSLTPATGTRRWSTGGLGSTISVNTTGTYWYEVTNACGSFSDTIDVTYLSPGNIFTADTIPLCVGGTYTLNSPDPGAQNLWSNSSTGTSINVTTPGNYWLQITLPCGVFRDTVYFSPSSPATVNLGPDVTICPGEILTLDAQNIGSTYQWPGGSSLQTFEVTAAGTYWAGVNNGCGFSYDTIVVTLDIAPSPNIANVISFCGTGTATADAGFWGNPTTYLWSDNSTSQVNNNLGAGSHWVRVINRCDTVVKNFTVQADGPLSINLGPDTTFCGTKLNLFAGVPAAGNQFSWNNGSTKSYLRVTQPGSYWVGVTNACGTYYDTIVVNITKVPTGISADTIYKCPGTPVNLEVARNNTLNYLWSTSATVFRATVTNPGMYWVKVFNSCGTLYDTVYVIDKTFLNFSLGPNTTVCAPLAKTFDFTNMDLDSVVWSDGTSSLTKSFSTSGTYWAIAFNGCTLAKDTFSLLVNHGAQEVINDTSFCPGAVVNVSAFQPQATGYAWSTGAFTSNIAISTPGWYYCDIFAPCGNVRDSFYVGVSSPIPPISLGNDTIFCAGTLLLDPGYFAHTRYLWQGNDTSQTYNVTKSGTYYVKVANSCTTRWDTINVLITGAPALVLGNNVRFCSGNSITLNAQNPGSTYMWSTGVSTQTITVTNGGKYWVDITNACGFITDTIEVIVEYNISNLNLGNDTTICRGDSVLLETQIPGVLTKWKNGSSRSSIYVKDSGNYWVEITNSCGSWGDTVRISVLDPHTFSLGPDTGICVNGGSTLLNGPPNMDTYTWSDGSTGSSLNVTTAGVYWLTGTNKCFSYTDTVNVIYDHPQNINFGYDTTLCAGDILTLRSGVTAHKQNWSTGSTDSILAVTETGVYWVNTRNSCGTYGDTIYVKFDEPLENINRDTIICDEDTAFIDLSNYSEGIIWDDGSFERKRFFTEAGTYSFSLINVCGKFDQSFEVEVRYCDCPFFMPNAFTPNNDGLNDEFKPGTVCTFTEYDFKVYNRWGQLVFETNNPDEAWNGTIGGAEAPEGMYSYIIDYGWYIYGLDMEKQHKGTIDLMR